MDWCQRARHSPSGSHRSQDSGFSDSECGGHGGSSPTGLNSRSTNSLGRKKTNKTKTRSSRNLREIPVKTSTKDRLNNDTCNIQNNTDIAIQERMWGDCLESTVQFIGSCEDLNNLPPPRHASTPKSTKHGMKEREMSSFSLAMLSCPVNLWLNEMRGTYEPECMSTLQSKSLISELSKQVTLLTAAATNKIKCIHQKTCTISNDLNLLYRKICCDKPNDYKAIINKIVNQMNHLFVEFPLDNQSSNGSNGNKETIEFMANRLLTIQSKSDMDYTKSVVKSTASAFSQHVDDLLFSQIKLLIAIIERQSTNTSLLCAISGLAGLSLKASHLGDLLARCDGITCLLSVCLSTRSSPVRTAVLRTLATICCTPNTIIQFEKGGGVEIICDILSDESKGDTELCEAVSVIAQVTAPWLEHGHTVHNIENHLIPLVSSLTRIINKTEATETLLLCAAALANISWAEPRSVWPLVYSGTVGILLSVVRHQGAKAGVFLKEQVATVLVNMSAVAEVRPHLTKNRSVPALLCFLQVPQSPLLSPAEIAASYRVQHKSAIALSRLCSEPEVAAQVVELQGIPRLTQLCKEEGERNSNNGVLVACLGALRKITMHCGRSVIDDINAKELVDPKLLDSFQLYSTKHSSFRES